MRTRLARRPLPQVTDLSDGGWRREDGDSLLRVATFNIRSAHALDGRHAWPFRAAACAAAIRGLDADVVGLQEVHTFQLRGLLRRLPGYAATGAGRDDGRDRGERCSVLIRTARLDLEWSETRWLSDTPRVPASRTWGNPIARVATLCRLSVKPGGLRLLLIDTHWDGASASSRRKSAELLLEWLDPGLPCVVLGDLNATTADAAVSRLLGSGLTDALASLPAKGRGAATHHPWDGATSGTRIDHVLVSRHWQVLEAAIAHERPGGRLASDHWPVAATLRLA